MTSWQAFFSPSHQFPRTGRPGWKGRWEGDRSSAVGNFSVCWGKPHFFFCSTVHSYVLHRMTGLPSQALVWINKHKAGGGILGGWMAEGQVLLSHSPAEHSRHQWEWVYFRVNTGPNVLEWQILNHQQIFRKFSECCSASFLVQAFTFKSSSSSKKKELLRHEWGDQTAPLCFTELYRSLSRFIPSLYSTIPWWAVGNYSIFTEMPATFLKPRLTKIILKSIGLSVISYLRKST